MLNVDKLTIVFLG